MVKIYLDMDGVFANFDEYWSARLKELGATGNLDIDDKDRELFRNEVADRQMFERLPYLVGADELLTIVYMAQSKGVQVEMLSASGLDDSAHVQRAAKQKRNWLDHYGIPFKANIVGRKKHKQLYVNGPDDIIIDDSKSTCKEWAKNGGTSILWSNELAFEGAQALKKILIDKGVF